MAHPFLALDLPLPSSPTSHTPNGVAERVAAIEATCYLIDDTWPRLVSKLLGTISTSISEKLLPSQARKGLRTCKVAFTPNWLSANSLHSKVCTVLALPRMMPSPMSEWPCNQHHYTAE
jgi:hypothetical protein